MWGALDVSIFVNSKQRRATFNSHGTQHTAGVFCEWVFFSLGQEVADALLAEGDELLRAGAARGELPQLGLLQQRGPARLSALGALRFGDELVQRQRPVDERVGERQQAVEGQHGRLRLRCRLLAQLRERREVHRALLVPDGEGIAALGRRGVRRRELRGAADAHTAVGRGGGARGGEAEEVKVRHDSVVVALVGAARPPCAGREVARRRVGWPGGDDGGVAQPESRLRRAPQLRRLHGAHEVAWHLWDDGAAPQQRCRRHEVVDEGVQPAEAEQPRPGIAARRRHLPPQGLHRGVRGGRQREDARARIVWRTARGEAELVEPAVPEAVRTQPEETTRLGTSAVRVRVRVRARVRVRVRGRVRRGGLPWTSTGAGSTSTCW
eukprot:scaffold68874_cov54-Phaeocystis_antarctica.AAC.2